ncbi:hypothetical protein LTR15_012721 [Elasticomyces elasticus]|nr:hypothetical protein LTR15_012721 [Elasticomyces elasticus]
MYEAVEKGTSFADLDKGVCSAEILEAMSDVLCFNSIYAFSNILKGDAKYRRIQTTQLRHCVNAEKPASIQRNLLTGYKDLVAIAVGTKYEWPTISKLKAAIKDRASVEGAGRHIIPRGAQKRITLGLQRAER